MAEIKQGGDQFASRWGLIATVLGMAVGTGNIWRFPREVASNNGGAFILICFLALFIWAVPLICAESVFGKKTRMANAGAFKVLLGDNWTWVGAWCAMVCVMLGCYYVVVLGWVMKYLSLIFTGFLTQVQAGGTELTSEVWKNFATTPPAVEAWMWFVAAVLIAAAIISRGVQGGIEKANKIMIPSVFILLAILLVRVLMLPGAWKGLEYMYHVELVDFARPNVWLAAFTQAAWSSGAGWGMFHVYFVYAAKDEDIMLNAFTATFGDMVAAMLAGMVVLPAVFALAPDPMAVMKSGANGLTFVNLTNLFAHTTGGFLMAVLFFIALFSAALSSVIAMVELGCRNLMDMGFSRPKATVFVTHSSL
ncbi:MAG: sodium-dependent transporter [Synergistota bacterium]|nr:sodium-dependent transporter [Synergistota bacterium]